MAGAIPVEAADVSGPEHNRNIFRRGAVVLKFPTAQPNSVVILSNVMNLQAKNGRFFDLRFFCVWHVSCFK